MRGSGVEAAAGGDRGSVALKLRVNLEREVVGEGDIDAAAAGENVGDGVKIEQRAGGIGVATVEIVNFAAAPEEIDIGAEVSEVSLDLAADEEVFLGVNLATVNGVGTANFDGGIEAVEGFETDVAAGGDAEILAAVEAGKGAGEAAKCGKGEGSGGGRHGLGMNEGGGNQNEAKQCEGVKRGLQSDSLLASLTRRLS